MSIPELERFRKDEQDEQVTAEEADRLDLWLDEPEEQTDQELATVTELETHRHETVVIPSTLEGFFSELLSPEQVALLGSFTSVQSDFLALEMGKIYREHATGRSLINRHIGHMRRMLRGATPGQIAREDGLTNANVIYAAFLKLEKLYTPHKERIAKTFEATRVLPADTEGPQDREFIFSTETQRQLGSLAIDENAEPLDDEEYGSRPVRKLDKQGSSDDLVRIYLNSIGKRALLNAAEEVELAKRIEAGVYAQQLITEKSMGQTALRGLTEHTARDLALVARDGEIAKQEMLEANLRLVVSIAKRYMNRGMDLLDLIQEGNLGLMRGVEKFDYKKGFKFSTYATWWIRQAITRGMADQGHAIRKPVHLVEIINKISRIKREMLQDLGHEPSIEDLAKEVGIEPGKVVELLELSHDPLSLDQTVGTEEEASLGEFIADDNEVSVGQVVETMYRNGGVAEAVALLPTEIMRRIARLRFGMEDGTVYTLENIGKRYGMQRGKASQILRQEVVPRLRVTMSRMGLDQFAETAIDGESSQLYEHVLDAVSQITNKRQRECIIAWFGLSDGVPLSNAQIAEKYGMPLRIVSIAVNAAKKQLEKTLPELFADIK